MVKGLESFKKFLEGYEEEYVIIGGTACDLLMMDTGLNFRATKDIDMVLILESLSPEFGKKFWDYIINAGYEHRSKSKGEAQFYRFTNPKSKEYPAMIELFSRRIQSLNLPDNAVLEPIHIEDEISSLSAILLNDDYYNLLRSGKVLLDGISILSAEYIIPFKMKAWLDLSIRKEKGEKIDSKNIRKHKNDIFRLTDLLYGDSRIQVMDSVYNDIQNFIDKMYSETVALKEIGIVGRNKNEILAELKTIYYI